MPMSDCPAEYPLAGVESIDTDLLLFGSIFLTSLEVDHVKLSAQRNAGQLTICLVAVHRELALGIEYRFVDPQPMNLGRVMLSCLKKLQARNLQARYFLLLANLSASEKPSR